MYDLVDGRNVERDSTLLGRESPLLFLGLADHWQPGQQPFPYGGVDLFQLARHKIHLLYPGKLHTDAAWVF
jgi:hypothetical protein